jgi:glyoxylase I family protein
MAGIEVMESMERMESVLGIGGVFFRARDPQRLGQWYADHLGVRQPPATYSEQPWHQEAGPTVFAPMPEESEHLGSPTQQWSINFRVRDLDATVAQLQEAGVKVDVHAESYPNGRFADLHDPEGNPIQLWQPVDGNTSI